MKTSVQGVKTSVQGDNLRTMVMMTRRVTKTSETGESSEEKIMTLRKVTKISKKSYEK